MTEDEMVGWRHWLNGHELGQVPRDSEGQGDLACCSPWGHKELGTTEGRSNNNLNQPMTHDCHQPHGNNSTCMLGLL